MPRAEIKDIYRDNSQRIVSGVKGGHGYQRTPYGYYGVHPSSRTGKKLN